MVWFVRHAEAEDGSPDADRRLTEKGRAQARAVAAAFRVLGVEVDGCLSSPKVRAVETARPICDALGLELVEERRLEGGPFDAQELLGEVGEAVVLVGHDPDFSLAVHRMTGAQVRMPKGGIAAVERGELKLLLRPRELRALAAAS